MPDTSLGPSPGCPDHVPCSENICKNGGTCQDLWSQKICICRTGFYGKSTKNKRQFIISCPIDTNLISAYQTQLHKTQLL